MHKPQDQVRDFHFRVVGGPTSPAEPALRDSRLRARLIAEEALEAMAGLVGSRAATRLARELCEEMDLERPTDPDVAEVVDGLCDLIYVAYGTAEAVGVDLEPYFDEVHRTNMLKDGAVDVDGRGKKGGKPPGWTPPRIDEMLRAESERWVKETREDDVEEALRSIDETLGRRG